MKTRIWIKSGVEEEFDIRQQRLLDLVYQKIRFYYSELYQTRSCHKHPLSLSRLTKLCNRSGSAVIHAVRILANTIKKEKDERPKIFYRRIISNNNSMHRPYQIFLRK